MSDRKEPSASRSNAAWIRALEPSAPDSGAVVSELESRLRRTLSRFLSTRRSDLDLDDLVQESLQRIVESLKAFRGDSAFLTWAIGVSLRVAFTQLRRSARTARHQRVLDDALGETEKPLRAVAAPPHDAAADRELHRALRDAIATQLTPRQRAAIIAELAGVPTIQIADRLGTNQNALYKLVHDARKRLRAALLRAGFSADALSRSRKESTR